MKSTGEGEVLSIGGAFEFMMSEWHLTPEYIINNWTDELFDLMVEKLIERKLRRAKPDGDTVQAPGTHIVSIEMLAKIAGKNIKVVKASGDKRR